jgi:hypothetical protein
VLIKLFAFCLEYRLQAEPQAIRDISPERRYSNILGTLLRGHFRAQALLLRPELGATSYERALALVTNESERRFLKRRLREVQSPPA